MKPTGNAALFLVETCFARVVCDQCTQARTKCSRGVPACSRCQAEGIACTRKQAKHDKRTARQLLRTNCQLTPRAVAPSSWEQVIETCTPSPSVRFSIRRFVIPLVPQLPAPEAAAELIRATKLFVNPRQKVSGIVASSGRMQRMFHLATRTFFYMVNPFMPLFSEESFHARPRSPTLRQIVIQIGLERMPPSALAREAIAANGFNANSLTQLPPTLDTLQCLLLTQFGILQSGIERMRFRIFCLLNTLSSLLGLHTAPPGSPQRLERLLALHLENYAFYHSSLGQSVKLAKCSWVATTGMARFLPLEPSDRIHLILSQAMYASYNVVLNLNKLLTKTLQEKSPTSTLSYAIEKGLEMATSIFSWGWRGLLKPARTTLLLQSRLALALRCYNDRLEIVKLALHIPPDPELPLSPAPLSRKVSNHSLEGLRVAVRIIRLASTLTAGSFGMDFIYILAPSVAFLLAHYKAFRREFGTAPQLQEALLLARASIERGLKVDPFQSKATIYLRLIDLIVKQRNLTKHLAS